MAEADFHDSEQLGTSGQAAEEGQDGPSERIVEFGWADNRPVTGRRAVKEKEKKKIKAGSFGTFSPQCLITADNSRTERVVVITFHFLFLSEAWLVSSLSARPATNFRQDICRLSHLTASPTSSKATESIHNRG